MLHGIYRKIVEDTEVMHIASGYDVTKKLLRADTTDCLIFILLALSDHRDAALYKLQQELYEKTNYTDFYQRSSFDHLPTDDMLPMAAVLYIPNKLYGEYIFVNFYYLNLFECLENDSGVIPNVLSVLYDK